MTARTGIQALLHAAMIRRCLPRGEAHACPQAVHEAHP